MKGKKAEATPKTKHELAVELSARANELAQSLDRSPLEIAKIAYDLQQDRDLLTELGFSSPKEWGEKTFGKKWKSVQNWAKVYAKLFVDGGHSEELILAVGTVKATLLARLSESEVRKQEWVDAARELNTSDFKKKVAAFLDQRPDHKEGFCKVNFDAPKSFRDEVWKPTIARGMAAEGTEEPYVVVEAMTANYKQELDNEDLDDDTTEEVLSENPAETTES